MNASKLSDLITKLTSEVRPAKVLRPGKPVEYPEGIWDAWIKGAAPAEAARKSCYHPMLHLSISTPMLPTSDDVEKMEVEPGFFRSIVDEIRETARHAPVGRPLGLAIEKDPVWGNPIRISLYYFGLPVDGNGVPILKP